MADDPRDFQKQLAVTPPKLSDLNDPTPIRLSLTLAFEPSLIQAVAAESVKAGTGIEEVIMATLRDRFAADFHEQASRQKNI